MPIRVDNIFYVTPDVERLSDHYSELLNVPARRAQVESPGLMWAEVPVGGMELSFRKSEATTKIHPRGENEFLEARPGAGVTVSFEVRDTEATIRRLAAKGCRFKGEPLVCTGGMEVISIFEDPTGRAVQLYEPRFKSGKMAVLAAARNAEMAGSFMQPEKAAGMLKTASGNQAAIVGALGTTNDDPAHRWGYVTTKEVMVGSNLRDGRNLAYSAAFYEPDLDVTKSFYGETLGLPLVYASAQRLRFDVDGTTLEFRLASPDDGYARANGLLVAGRGGIAMFEVRQLASAVQRMQSLKMRRLEISRPEPDEVGKRAAFVDVEGNVFEFWERPDVAPLQTALLQSERLASLETWEFHSAA